MEGFPVEGFPVESFPAEGFPAEGFPVEGFPQGGRVCARQGFALGRGLALRWVLPSDGFGP